MFPQYKLGHRLLIVVLNKLRSYYSRTSVFGPEGHCTNCFQRVKCILCRQHVDVHKRAEVNLKWTHVYGGSKTWFPCGLHKWMTPKTSRNGVQVLIFSRSVPVLHNLRLQHCSRLLKRHWKPSAGNQYSYLPFPVPSPPHFHHATSDTGRQRSHK